jgi:MYND finger
MIKMVYAETADHVIRSDYKIARNEFVFAGQLELFRAQMLLKYEEEERSFHRARTERDTILSLTKLIPCSCLEKAKKEAKKWPATDYCQFCGVEGSQDKFLVCSACELNGYCSKDCQKADWNAGHKIHCRQTSVFRTGGTK